MCVLATFDFRREPVEAAVAGQPKRFLASLSRAVQLRAGDAGASLSLGRW